MFDLRQQSDSRPLYMGMHTSIPTQIRTPVIATLVYDRDTLAIVAATESAAGSLGYSRDELLELSIADIHPVEDVPTALSILIAASGPVRLGAEPDPPWRLARKDGSITQAEIESDEIEPAGRACRFLLWHERRGATVPPAPELETFALRSLLLQACTGAVSQAREKRIGLDIDLAPDLPDLVLGQPERLQIAVEQLADAAIAATARGGVVVSVRVRAETSNGALVRVEVSDTGLGVDPAIVAGTTTAGERTETHSHASIALSRASGLFASIGATIKSLREPGLGSFVWVDVPLKKPRFPRAAGSFRQQQRDTFGELRAAA
jgi:hypothetical protein